MTKLQPAGNNPALCWGYNKQRGITTMKHTARLTACLLALALTACTAAPQDVPAGTTTETAAAPVQTVEPTTETPAMQGTLTPVYTTWGTAVGQDAVYSAMNIDDAGQYYATTIDFSTGEQRILCKKPGCSHADESCPAYMTAIRNGCVPQAMLLPVGDRLYWLVDGRHNESDSAYLDVSNPDGSDRRRVAEGDDLPDLTNAYVWYTDGTALYTFVRSYDKYSAVRLDEGGAACLFTRSIPDGEDYFAVGCWQDKIVLQHSGGYLQQPLNPAGAAATDEELRAWLAADEQAQNEQTKNLCLLDTAGGMTDTDMTWGGDAGNVQLVHNGAAYVLNESGLVTKFDLAAGTAQTRQLDLQGTQILYGVVEGARLDGWIPVTVRDDSEGLLNPETGVYTPLPTTWLKDQAVERSPFIVAASDTMLLVKYGEIYYTTNDIGTDGAPYSFTTCRGEYGIISAADYLAGSQDWVQVTLQGRDLV